MERGPTLFPHEKELLSDQQLRDASLEQIENLVQRINLALQRRGMDGLVWQQLVTRTDRQHPDK